MQKTQSPFYLVRDGAACRFLIEKIGRSRKYAESVVDGYRQEARKRGVPEWVRIHAIIQAGATLKQLVRQMGISLIEFDNLWHDWNGFAKTNRSIVSWIPVPLAETKGMTITEQTQAIADLKARCGLPKNHPISAGPVVYLTGMVLAHSIAAGQRPFKRELIRTATCLEDGFWICLSWNEISGLFYDRLFWGDGEPGKGYSVFAMGIEKVGKTNQSKCMRECIKEGKNEQKR